MTHIEKIKKIMDEHNGVVTSAMLTKEGIPRLYLKHLTESGELQFVSRGIYVSSNAFEDEMYILQCKYSKGIFSHETALYIHGYSDRAPAKYTMTFNYGYHSSSLKTENVIDRYAVANVYNLGVTQAKSPCGNDIIIYNIEKTLCDVVKGNNTCDVQIVNMAMKKYAQSKEKNLNLLFEYADWLKVKKKILNYMEVLL
ncbi:MAG: type IV toxin-antitoxin system AbiEi family antitoxin domain-containing protein [Clostridia bacterium]|nr:type IV toxin-antitoxin system AbiEi family antitoxin domain-containing protein [Clostridia bacterium]